MDGAGLSGHLRRAQPSLQSTVDEDNQSTSHSSAHSRGSHSKGTSRGSHARRQPGVPNAGVAAPSTVFVEPAKIEFTPALIPAGLSQLGRTADGLRPAFLTLRVSGTDLATTDPLASFPHLQALLLSDNALTSVRSLGALHSLTLLDVSHNKLTQVLDIDYSSSDINLREADFSCNCLLSLRDLSGYSRLQSLRLDRNRLESFVGLRSLGMLRSLSVTHNQVRSCAGLEGLVGLKSLHLQGNRLSTLQPLSCLCSLEVLTAADNRLSVLDGLQHLTCLRHLDISNNLLPTLEELAHARHAPLLSHLSMDRNPLMKALDLRLHVVHLLPQVAVLDGQPVEAKEKVLAANMHGADAEGLRLIRRRYFPDGELDDGGGALPPTSAGLIASAAEEEAEGGGPGGALEGALLRVDAWARGVKTGTAMTSVNPVVALADALASVCGEDQLLRARAVHEWVVGSVALPLRRHTWLATPLPLHPHAVGSAHLGGVVTWKTRARVQATHGMASKNPMSAVSSAPDPPPQATPPLFRSPAVESALLGGVGGNWAERVAWLFTTLARACELEAVTINGYWKDGELLPGERVYAHNHCWTAVKVNGHWRLIDCAADALASGKTPPFFNPPAAFVYSHWPLAAAWQLLPEPISLEAWWALPPATTAFFANGCQLSEPRMDGVVRLEAVRQGRVLPTYHLGLAFPITPGSWVSHRLLDASLRPLSQWPHLSGNPAAAPRQAPPHPSPSMPTDPNTPNILEKMESEPSDPALAAAAAAAAEAAAAGGAAASGPPPPPAMASAFQQAVSGPRGAVEVRCGGRAFGATTHQLWVAPPCPGVFYLEVACVTQLAGVVRLAIKGLDLPWEPAIVEEEVVLRLKLIVPEVLPHDPWEGVLLSSHTPPCPLPTTHPTMTLLRAQLISPRPNQPLEADRLQDFNIIVPGVTRVMLVSHTGGHQQELSASEDGHSFSAALHVPRCSSCTLLAMVADKALGVHSWEPLVTFQVAPQSQHIVHNAEEEEVLELEADDPKAHSCRELFNALDLDSDGRVSRREALVAFRRNRQYADFLRFPAKVRSSDATFDTFVDMFLQIDSSKLGTFQLHDLAKYMGVHQRGMCGKPMSENGSDSGSYDSLDDREEGTDADRMEIPS
ncbi:MAG: hypothetical protein WDW36_003191 [Sanguina aurantia]